MITQVVHCPYCRGTDIVRHGTTPEGKQRYRCRTCPTRGRTFLLEYAYAGQSPDVKRQIVEMALNASGIVLAYLFGRRQDTVFLQLKELLEPFGIRRFYTDGWGAYERHLAPEQHVVG